MTVSNDVLATNIEELAELYLLQSILNNMQNNLSLISEGATGQTVIMTNANLFQVATQYYGDPNQWVTIADANGLSSPYATGGTILSINLTNGGVNYINPIAQFSGDQINPPTILFNVIDGVIQGVQVLIGGLFATFPQITIIDSVGNGSGATAIATCVQTLIIPQSSKSTSGGLLTL